MAYDVGGLGSTCSTSLPQQIYALYIKAEDLNLIKLVNMNNEVQQMAQELHRMTMAPVPPPIWSSVTAATFWASSVSSYGSQTPTTDI